MYPCPWLSEKKCDRITEGLPQRTERSSQLFRDGLVCCTINNVASVFVHISLRENYCLALVFSSASYSCPHSVPVHYLVISSPILRCGSMAVFTWYRFVAPQTCVELLHGEWVGYSPHTQCCGLWVPFCFVLRQTHPSFHWVCSTWPLACSHSRLACPTGLSLRLHQAVSTSGKGTVYPPAPGTALTSSRLLNVCHYMQANFLSPYYLTGAWFLHYQEWHHC